MESLGKLTRVLGDVEERIEKMQQAREWIARTETRLTETGKKAEENIALLGTLIDKDNKNKKSQKGGAPSIDKREMVVKLAHQGWTSENIAQATGLSRGEVELILEIMPKK
jgi:DNA-directed RNA polymerase specialized sigma24 family protein